MSWQFQQDAIGVFAGIGRALQPACNEQHDTRTAANGAWRATPSDSASTKRVGAGSAVPKPSKIVLNVGTTPIRRPAVIASDSSTITG